MAKRVITATQVTLGGTDRTALVRSAELSIESDAPETTNMASGGWREFLGGLKGFTLSIEFVRDADLSGLDSDIWTEFDSGDSIMAFVVQPTGDALGPTNPTYSGSVVITDWAPITGAVGDVFSNSVSWQGTGTITRATS